MGFLIKRKVFRLGRSYALSLPSWWCDYYHVKAVTLVGDALVIVAPEGYEEQARELIEEARTMVKK
jgi:hypothetical protein